MNWHLLTSAIERAVLVVAVRRGDRRIYNHIICQVPLAKMCSAVSRLLKELRNRWGCRAEPIRHVPSGIVRHPSEMAVDIVPSWKVPRHDRGPTRRTNATGYRKAMKVRSLFR